MTSPEYVVLERGAACLPCKKRKKRCDAARPVCGPCIRAETTGACQYTQKQIPKVPSPPRKSERLKTQVRQLEDQVATLERQASVSSQGSSSSYSEPKVESLHGSGDVDEDAMDMDMEITTPTSVVSPGRSASTRPEHLHHLHHFHSHGQSQLQQLQPQVAVPAPPLPDWREELLKIFLENRHQCAFEIHEPHFVDSFRLSFGSTTAATNPHAHGHARQMHPALMNAVFLIACHFSSYSPSLPSSSSSPSPHQAQTQELQWTQHEPYFLSQTQEHLVTSLAHADRLGDFVQATVLLARWFFLKGRCVEAQYHISGLACFSVGLNLNVLTLPSSSPPRPPPSSSSSPSSSFPSRLSSGIHPPPSTRPILPSPANPIEQDERISLFWSIYLLDRTSSIICGVPVAIPDSSIALPWARGWEVYGSSRSPTQSNEPTLAEWMHLPSPHFASPADLDSTLSLRVIGATIFQRAVGLVRVFQSSTGYPYEIVTRDRTLLIESIERIEKWLPAFPFDLGLGNGGGYDNNNNDASPFLHPNPHSNSNYAPSFEYHHDLREYDLDARLGLGLGLGFSDQGTNTNTNTNSYSPLLLHAEPSNYSHVDRTYSPFENFDASDISHPQPQSHTTSSLVSFVAASSSSSSSSSGNSVYGDAYSTPPPLSQPSSSFYSTGGYSSPPPLQGSSLYSSSPPLPPLLPPQQQEPIISSEALAALLFTHSAVQSTRIYLDRVFVPGEYGGYTWDSSAGFVGGGDNSARSSGSFHLGGGGGARDAAMQIVEMARWALDREARVGSFFCQLELLVGMCWTAAFETLSEPSPPSAMLFFEIDNDVPLDILRRALDTLARFIPLVGAMAASVGSSTSTVG